MIYLRQPHNNEQDGCSDAHHVVGGETSYEHCWDRHCIDRDHQGCLPAVLVPNVAKEECSYWPSNETWLQNEGAELVNVVFNRSRQ